MEKILELLAKINLNFCGDHRQILIFQLTSDKEINLGLLVDEIQNCEKCRNLITPELKKIKSELTPFKIGTLLTNYLTTK